MLRLTAEQGPDAGRVFLTRSKYAVVGRNGEIALNDRNVSTYHALLQVQPNGTMLITDLNSEGGTWLGYGERTATQLTLKSGMCFKVGGTVLRVEVEQPTTEASSQPAPSASEQHPHVVHVAHGRSGLTGALSSPATESFSTAKPNAVVPPQHASSLELEFDPDIFETASRS